MIFEDLPVIDQVKLFPVLLVIIKLIKLDSEFENSKIYARKIWVFLIDKCRTDNFELRI